MTAGAKTKLQVDSVISIRLPSATNEPQATELTHWVLSLGKRPWFLIVLLSMMLLKRSFGFMRSLFILYVHEYGHLDFGMLTVETAVFDCIYRYPVATEKVSHIRSNIIWNWWKSTWRARSITVNLNQGTVYFVNQARGNTRVCLRWTSMRLQMFTYIWASCLE